MNCLAFISSGPLLALALVFGVIAAALLKLGYWPARQGRTRRCRSCNYILARVRADYCPECGGEIGPDMVVYGQRRRNLRVGRTGIGFVVAALASLGAALVGWGRSVDWYRLRPTSMVIGDLKLVNTPPAQQAWKELHRRLNAGDMSPEQCNEVYAAAMTAMDNGLHRAEPSMLEVLTAEYRLMSAASADQYAARLVAALRSDQLNDREDGLKQLQNLLEPMLVSPPPSLTQVALAEQVADPPPGINPDARKWLLEYLGKLAARERLSGTDRAAFVLCITETQLLVRPRILENERIAYQIRMPGVLLEPAWRVSAEIRSVRVDGTPASITRRPDNVPIRMGISGSDLPPLPPGEHELEVEFAQQIRIPDGNGTWPTMCNRTLPLKARFTVGSTADPVNWIDDATLREGVPSAISPGSANIWDRAAGRLDIAITVKDSPAPLAMDVVAWVGQKEHPIGAIAVRRHEGGVFYLSTSGFPIGEISNQSLVLIFRSSEAAVRRTPDLTEAWRGEFVYKFLAVRGLSN